MKLNKKMSLKVYFLNDKTFNYVGVDEIEDNKTQYIVRKDKEVVAVLERRNITQIIISEVE